MADISRTIEINVDTRQGVRATDELTKSLDENEKQTEETKDETKQYEKSLDSSSEASKGLTAQLDRMTGGLITTSKNVLTAVKSLKSLRIAFAALGIGAIVAVVGALGAAFTRLNGPMSQLQNILGGLDGILNVLLDRFALFGAAILDLLKGDTESALQNFQDSWEGVGDAMEKAYELGVLIAKQTRENSVNESARNVLIAKNNRLITEQRLIYRDVTKDLEERRIAAAEANRLQLENIALETKSAKERLQIAINTFENSSKTYEDQIAYNEALESYYQSIGNLEQQQIRLKAAEATIEKQILTANEKNVQTNQIQIDQQKEINQELQVEKDLVEDINGKGVESAIENNDAFLDQIGTRIQAEEQLKEAGEEDIKTQQNLQQALTATSGSAQGLLDVITGKTTGKDAFKTVFSILTSLLSFVPGGSAIAGVANIFGGLFADGGEIRGPSHARGGVWINAEGGEGVINKRSMSIPWVRSLASELNEIGGGVKFADGGVVPSPTATESSINTLQALMAEQRIVLPIPDLTTEATKVQVIQDRSTL
jgi:hypothetical protein